MSGRLWRRGPELVRSIDHALVEAEDLRRACICERGHFDAVWMRICVGSLTRGLGRVEAAHRALGYDYDPDRPFDFEDLDDDLAADVDAARGLVSDIASAVGGGIEHVRAVDLEMAQDLAIELRSALRHARAVALALHREDTWSSRRMRRSAVVEAWSARKVVGIAARLVQVDHRARYAEEFRGELHELAAAGAGRIRQLNYAVSQLLRAPALRIELRSGRRRSASP